MANSKHTGKLLHSLLYYGKSNIRCKQLLILFFAFVLICFYFDRSSTITALVGISTIYIAFYAIAWAKYEFYVTRHSQQMSVLCSLCATENRKSFAPALVEMTNKKLPDYPTLFTPRLVLESLRAKSDDPNFLSMQNSETISMVSRIISGFDDWSGANFTGINLYNVDLHKANLRGICLNEAELFGGILSEADLSGACLEGAHLETAHLYEARLINVKLRDACLYSAHLLQADLSGSDLRGANLSNATLNKANLSNADLKGADLSDAHLEGANLSNADLIGANLSNAKLSKANLQGAKLRGQIYPPYANQYAVNLQGATLQEANLQGVNLEGVNLEGADLRGANLEGASCPSTACED